MVIVIGLVVVPQGTVLLLTLMYLLAKRYTTWVAAEYHLSLIEIVRNSEKIFGRFVLAATVPASSEKKNPVSVVAGRRAKCRAGV